jgi:UDP-N-acetylmuramate--alanine ligase
MGLVTPVEPVPADQLGAVHFIGIGGAGMSGIARIMLSRGSTVSGSDSVPSALLDELAAAGARVAVGHSAENLGGTDTVVVSTAIRPDNPELVAAQQRGLRVLHRAAALASLMLGRRRIAVAGTHGKTTTTSMITTVLLNSGAQPSYVIGGILADTGLGAADGPGPHFVIEADESDGSFLMFAPDAAVVTSVEADHLDNYGTLAAVEAAFAAFAGRIIDGGLLLVSADGAGARALARAVRPGVTALTYGTAADADYQVTDIETRGMRTRLTVTGGARTAVAGAGPVRLELAVPGRHNALNAAAAFGLTVQLGVPVADAVTGLAAYRGARHRLELKGEADGVQVIDSYAHHPTELAVDLAAARAIAGGADWAEDGGGRGETGAAVRGEAGAAVRGEDGAAGGDEDGGGRGESGATVRGEDGGGRGEDGGAGRGEDGGAGRGEAGPGGRVIAVFQPHLFSRTRIFAAEFGAALGQADEVLVLDVYAAREDPEPGVTGRLVADAVPGGAVFLPDKSAVPAVVAGLAKPGDLVLTMGAGDVTTLGPQIVAALRERSGDT